MNQHTHAMPEPLSADAQPLMVPPSEEMLARLEQRRSAPLRGLAGPGPTPDELTRMMILATRVPDHGRLVPWRFILVEGDARRDLGERLDALYGAQAKDAVPPVAAPPGDMWTQYMTRAPLTVILVSKPDMASKVPAWNQVLSAGAAGMALTVAASALGFTSQWLLKWPGRDPEATALLGLTPAERVAGFIHIGRPVALNAERPRPVLDQVVTSWAPPAGMPAQSSISNETP